MLQALTFLWALHSPAAELDVIKRIFGFSIMQISSMVITELNIFLPYQKASLERKVNTKEFLTIFLLHKDK